MLVDLTIKNYRCFSDTEPARIQLRKGFTGLIGVNNCGKSSLLRFFYEFRKLFDLLSRSDNNFISVVAANAIAFGPPDNVLDLQEMFSNANVRDIELQFLFIPEPGDQEQRKFTAKVIVRRPTNTFQFELFMEGRSLRGMGFNPSTQAVFAGGQPANHVATLSFLFDAFSTLANTLYIGPFRNAINIGTNSNYFDMPTGQSFISTWRARKTGKSKIMQEDILRLTEDIRRIFGFRQLEINSTDDNLTMQLYIDGKSYFLPELGSGVAHFILVLAGAAFEKPSYILIDEPEMGLHPSLQLDFLTTLHSYAREGVIFSTHSIGLAKASAERIYSLRKKDDGTTQLKEFGTTARLSEFLGELSFSGYQELGFDKILLVEGVTDVKTFQQFLRKYKLEHKIVLLPLGGESLINGSRELELQELKRISQNVFAIIDSERTAQGKDPSLGRLAFVETCKAVGINCHVLERRATENYLVERAVKVFKGDAFRALRPYETLADVSPSWRKEENWRIAREMTRDELDLTDLGAFLQKL